MSGRDAEIDELNRRSWDRMLSAPDEALSLAEAAYAAAEERQYAEGLAEASLNVGWCEHYLTRSGPAIESVQKALDRFTELGDEVGVMKALNALGVIYYSMARYERAMDYYTRSLEEARRCGNRLREAVTLSNIGEVCLDLGELKEALDYFLRAYETVPDDRETELVSNVLLNIGTTFHRMENWPLAREFTEKALGIATSSGELMIEAMCWHSLGRIAQASDRYELAEQHYLKALGIDERLKSEAQRSALLLDFGSLKVRQGELQQALESYRVALAVAGEIGAKSLMHGAFERLSEAHEILGDHKAALDYYRRFSRYEHEVLNEDTSRKIKNITVQYEVEKSRQEAEIYRLKNIELKDKTEALEDANRQILAIAETGRSITASLDFDTIAAKLHESLARHMDTTWFGIALYDEDEGSIDWRIIVDRGTRIHFSEQAFDPARSLAAWSIVNRSRVVMSDGEKEYKRYLKGEPQSVRQMTKSLVFIPLMIENRAIGVLTVQSYEEKAYDAKHLNLLEALSPYVAIAIENSLIHDRLEILNKTISGEKKKLEKAAQKITHLANHDVLTGLPNRRLLFELLQKTFDIASRNGTKVGVIYIDLDDFKPINDRLGHMAGDRALVAIAEKLGSILRASDTVARVGGDEFIAVLSNAADRTHVEAAANKILEICAEPVIFEGSECRIGISMGIAIYPDDGATIDQLVNAADTAMYTIKRGSKNGFAFASGAPGGAQTSAAVRR